MPIMQNRFGHIIAQCTDVVQIIEQWTSSGKVFIFGPLCLLFGKSPDIFTEMFARCRVIYFKVVCTLVQHSRAEKSTQTFWQPDFCAQNCSEVLRAKSTKYGTFFVLNK